MAVEMGSGLLFVRTRRVGNDAFNYGDVFGFYTRAPFTHNHHNHRHMMCVCVLCGFTISMHAAPSVARSTLCIGGWVDKVWQ